ncbi:MAG: hypothetical protein WCE51_12750 [Chthoniobacterales bacterium]
MKLNKAVIVLASSALFCGSAFAGPPESKEVAPAPPAPTEYGTGWYFGVDTGANVYQGLSGNTNKNIDGNVLSFKTNSNVGWFGGLKFGYVFGTGVFRPAIEEDWYYNGFKTDNDILLNGTRIGGGQSTIRSGAFMTNFIGRFALGRFQPYLGASIGGYYARAVDSAIGVTVGDQTFVTNKGGNSGSLAWGAVAGADYYWTPKYSTFLEYKFLDYTALDVGNGNHHIGQQLVGAGFRIHF